MVPKIRRGSRTHGVLVYLFGPGKRDEHTDAHLVGSWDGFAPDPGRDTTPNPTRRSPSPGWPPRWTCASRRPARQLRPSTCGTARCVPIPATAS
jgi:hypothetical protein